MPVGGKGFALKDCDPGAKPYGNGDKNGDKARVAELASEIDALTIRKGHKKSVVALNLQTAFLSPPVAMSAFYLKGVAPPHVTLNQIFLGMLPFMGIQILAIVLLYIFPQIGLWLPQILYK